MKPAKKTAFQRVFRSPSITSAGIFFAAICGITAGALASTGGPISYGDAFVTSSIAEPSNLIPFLATDTPSAEISQLVFDGLVKYDKDLNLIGNLAESWDVSGDGLTITFHLKPNVRWQDGAPFSSEDVLFTYQVIRNPKTPTPYSGEFEKVASVETPDPLTVIVRYKEPFSPGLASWSMGIVPKHLLKNENLLETRFARAPVGTGPYVLKRWKSGESLYLESNRDYFDGRPGIDRYLYRIIPDPATAFLELETGNLDFAALTPLQFSRLTDTPYFKKHYTKYRYSSFAYTYIGLNLENALFADPRVRRAVSLAANRKEIIDVTLLGSGRVTTGPFLPESWAYDASIPEVPFDPQKAQKLLDEAGWAIGGSGLRQKDGRVFSFTLLTNQGSEPRKMAAEMIQKRLREIGIDMKIQIVEWGTFLKEFIDKKRFDAVLLAWHLSPDPDVHDIFHSSKTKPGEFNFVSYTNPEVDRLLDEGRRVFDQGQRRAIYHRIHRLIHEDEPYIFLYVPESLVHVQNRFRGLEPSPIGLGHNFPKWFVPAEDRKYGPGRPEVAS